MVTRGPRGRYGCHLVALLGVVHGLAGAGPFASEEIDVMAQIAVIGASYVGLTTAACFARLGHDVVCADIDEAKVAQLQRGEVPIVEAGLEGLVREGLESGRLSFVLGGRQRLRLGRVRLPVRTDAAERRRLGRPVVHRGGRA